MKKHLRQLAETSPIYTKLADKYVSPRDYEDWNLTVARYALTGHPLSLGEMANHYSHLSDTRNIIETGVGANIAERLDAPAVYLDPNLADALLQTDVNVMSPPELVLPCFFICLPKNKLYCDEGYPISSLLVTVQHVYLDHVKDILNIPKAHYARLCETDKAAGNTDRIRVFAYTNDGSVISLTYGWDQDTLVDHDDTPIHPSDLFDHEFDENNFRKMTSQIMRVVKNVILIYNYQRNLVYTCVVQPHSKGFGFKERKAKRAPLPITLLGKDFLVRNSSRQSPDATKTGLTVRPHWRKGHWHTTVCGTGRKERRLKWFQPVYVNASLDT
jgi:hypothetical protein